MAKRSSKAVATLGGEALPAYMQEGKVRSEGTIGQSDLVLARIKICQKTTKGKEQVPGIKDGLFFHTISKENLGNHIDFFVCCHFKSRVWFDKGLNLIGLEQQNVKLIESKDGSCSIKVDGVVRFGDQVKECVDEKYEEGKETDNYLIVTAASLEEAVNSKAMPDVAILNCMKAARKASKQLNSKIMSNNLKGIPCFGQMISATTALESFDAGDAFMPTFTYGRYANKEEFSLLTSFFPYAVRMVARVDAVAAAHSE